MSKTPNTTGTISGDLEAARRKDAQETALRLARLGPISRGVFDLGRTTIHALQLLVFVLVPWVLWVKIPIPIEFQSLELVARVLSTVAGAAGIGTACYVALDFAAWWWDGLWLPPRS